jgi:hypothetical protein
MRNLFATNRKTVTDAAVIVLLALFSAGAGYFMVKMFGGLFA